MMKPTINPDEIIADPKDDQVGRLLNAMGSLNNWTKERFALKNEIIKRMKRLKHVAFQSDKRLFQLSRVGSSLLYQVPEHKRGYLDPFRGRLIRLVCVGSHGRNLCTYIATQYSTAPNHSHSPFHA